MSPALLQTHLTIAQNKSNHPPASDMRMETNNTPKGFDYKKHQSSLKSHWHYYSSGTIIYLLGYWQFLVAFGRSEDENQFYWLLPWTGILVGLQWWCLLMCNLKPDCTLLFTFLGIFLKLCNGSVTSTHHPFLYKSSNYIKSRQNTAVFKKHLP